MWFMTLRIALRALARNKLRSFLTMLGIIIGVGAVIAMVAIGEGAKATIRSQIASLGTNVLIILPNDDSGRCQSRFWQRQYADGRRCQGHQRRNTVRFIYIPRFASSGPSGCGQSKLGHFGSRRRARVSTDT